MTVGSELVIAVRMCVDNDCVTSSIISAAVALSHMTQQGISHHLANLQRGGTDGTLPLSLVREVVICTYDASSFLR